MVVWDYESPPDPDPMDKILDVDKPELTEEEVEEIAEAAAEEVSQIAAAKVAEKIAEKVAEAQETEVGPVGDEPKGKKNGNGKKKVAAKKPTKKKE